MQDLIQNKRKVLYGFLLFSLGSAAIYGLYKLFKKNELKAIKDETNNNSENDKSYNINNNNLNEKPIIPENEFLKLLDQVTENVVTNLAIGLELIRGDSHNEKNKNLSMELIGPARQQFKSEGK
jgi:hypothetical protein